MTGPQIVRTDGRHSVHFDGPEKALRDAVRAVGCPFQMTTPTRRMSVPKQYGEQIARALGITERGLW